MKPSQVVALALCAALIGFGAGYYVASRQPAEAGAAATATPTPVTRYRAYVHGTARDASGAPVANVKVTVNGKSSTTNTSGEWGVTPPVTVGQTYYFEIAVPDGWQLTQWPASFVATEPPDPIGPFTIVLAPIPAPQPTETATYPPVPQPPTDTPSATPTDKLPPGTPTPVLGTITPTPTALPTGAIEIVGYLRGVGEVCQCKADYFLMRTDDSGKVTVIEP
jgi:hypothetical protein